MVAVKCEETVLLQLGVYIKYIGIFPQFLTSSPHVLANFTKKCWQFFVNLWRITQGTVDVFYAMPLSAFLADMKSTCGLGWF